VSALVIALTCFAIASWGSTFLLARAAYWHPRIGALTERAIIAFVLSVFGSASVVLVWNTESGQALFPVEIARTISRLDLFVLLLIPIAWLVLYATNRLGGGQ
jgi:hypothetical protein